MIMVLTQRSHSLIDFSLLSILWSLSTAIISVDLFPRDRLMRRDRRSAKSGSMIKNRNSNKKDKRMQSMFKKLSKKLIKKLPNKSKRIIRNIKNSFKTRIKSTLKLLKNFMISSRLRIKNMLIHRRSLKMIWLDKNVRTPIEKKRKSLRGQTAIFISL